MPISWEDAIVAGQERINAKCREQGIDPLTGHDIAILAAHRTGERLYKATLALHGDKPEFDEQAIQFAAKCIAQAILC